MQRTVSRAPGPPAPATSRAEPVHPPASPAWVVWAPWAAMFWALAYGAVRAWWALGGAPSFGPLERDLLIFTGWGAVGLCAVAAGTALALKLAPWWRPLLVTGYAVCALLLVAAAVLLLDVVGGVLPGIGVPFQPVAFLSRAGCAAEGALLAAASVAYRRRCRSECLFCGRAGVTVRPASTPRWAFFAASMAVAGCLVRLGAQLAVGFEGSWLRVSPSVLLFEAGFVLAGTALPLALVLPWGRVFPRWAPLVAGRRVPRWLVLGPGLGIGGAMTAYFGMTLVMLVAATLTGTAGRLTQPFPVAFFWVAVPAYFVWGLGLVAAATAYYRVTRPPCRVCGR